MLSIKEGETFSGLKMSHSFSCLRKQNVFGCSKYCFSAEGLESAALHPVKMRRAVGDSGPDQRAHCAPIAQTRQQLITHRF